MPKGLTLVTMMLMILVLVMFAGMVYPLLLGWTNESLRQRAELNANEIAGIINMLQASPPGTFHAMQMEKECVIDVSSDVVRVAASRQEFTINTHVMKAGIIKSGVGVEPANLDCDGSALYLMRCGSTIKMLKNKKPCDL